MCPKCGCVFVADKNETTRCVRRNTTTGRTSVYAYFVKCPCREEISWDNGEPYEEPTQDGIDRLTSIIADLGYVNETTAWDIAVQLAEHGVTFREG